MLRSAKRVGLLIALTLQCVAHAAGQVTEGVALFNQGEYPRALFIFDKLVDKNPTDADAHFWRANCLSRLNRMKDAVAEYKLAYLLSTDPKVKEYSQNVLKQYQAMPKVASIASVPVPKKKTNDAISKKNDKTFKLKTEELNWNIELTKDFKDSLKGEHAKLDRLIAKADSGGGGRRFSPSLSDDYLNSPPHNITALSGVEVEALSRYSVVIVLDRSSSMGHSDCPGGSPVGGPNIPIPRSEWCAQELQLFATTAKGCFPRGVTVMPFNDNYEVIRNCSAGELARIAASHAPAGGTELGKALEAAMGQRDQSSKRLAIIVLTDGIPHDPDRVAQAIKNTTCRTRPNEVHILFLTIGADVGGADLLEHFDEDLPQEGASYDAVTTLSFPELKKNGLAHTLAKAVLNK